MRGALLAVTLVASCVAPTAPPAGEEPPSDSRPSLSLSTDRAPLLPGDDDDVSDDEDGTPEPLAPTICPDPALPQPTTTFADVSLCAGIEAVPPDLGPVAPIGASWADVDGDGDPDLVVTSSDGNTLYLNEQGRFEPSAPHAPAALAGRANVSATFADYDNDGDKDLFVGAIGPNALLRNEGDGTWVDVTDFAGLHHDGWGSVGSWGDYDGDGFLDLYLSNYICDSCDPLPPESDFVHDRLFHNEGDGTFEDVSALLGFDQLTTLGFAAAWLDYDDDNDPDLFVGADRGNDNVWEPGDLMNRNLFFRNDGPGCGGWCFEEVGRDIGAGLSMDTMGVAVADYDNDNDLDLAITGTYEVRLLQNHDGFFVESTLSAGLDQPDFGVMWGIVFFDYDNDGDMDLYVVDGTRDDHRPNRLFGNDGDGNFSDVSLGSGTDQVGDGRGVSTADYDGDGWADLIVSERASRYTLLRNLGGNSTPANWLRLRLEGGGPVNRDAVGARVGVVMTTGAVQMQEVKIGSSMGANHDPALHFGLGEASATHAVVQWPDGSSTVINAPPDRVELVLSYPPD